MKIKYSLLAMATVAITQQAFAQYSQDAIRFSGSQAGSTSRIKAIGNANVAVGGDLTAIGSNPAGLGFFTRSELSITPEFNMSKSNSSYLTGNSNDKRNDANFNNASVVFYGKLNKGRGEDKTKGWLSVNFGASYARTNNFYQNTYYSAVNPNSSIADYYAYLGNQAVDNGFSLDGYLEGWARNHQLINNNADPNTYVPATTLGGTQSNTITSTGGQTEYNFSFGANYSNKLYIGAGFGITNIRYNSTSDFVEDNFNLANNRDFISTYTRDQVTKGNGFNARFGFIYKPVEAVRVGATVTTPTWYTVDDNSYEGLATNYVGGANYRNSDTYPARYNMRTPFKVAGGLAVFLGKAGFITGDVEYLDYTSTKITSDDYDVTQDNNDIKRNYQSAVNARIGAEARLPGSFFLRGGFGIQGSPSKTNASDIKTASGGLGYRFANYYIDATYTHVRRTNSQLPYDIGDFSPVADIKSKNSNVFLTMGLRF
ncbi:hypothetical protein ABDD95_06635 [Mucilaginibacter sp. PAMB04274]|uniref:OmpP1/FadL family transporter n=1 Tax=Mucilaginibacter sp. PAMB04274 TaxID=3138568 RepID=UPI0031F5F579